MLVPPPSRPAQRPPPTSLVVEHRELPLPLRRLDGTLLELDGSRCAVMAILNLTPDSFSDGGRYDDPGLAVARALSLVDAGADVLDVGAESTRPGAALLTVDEEWQRLEPLLGRLVVAAPSVVLSLDTRRAEVARRAAACGVRMLNLTFPQHLLVPVAPDPPQSALTLGERQALLSSFDAVVVMHSRGTPATMRAETSYPPDLAQAVVSELQALVRELFGPLPPGRRERLIFDPGLGFAKTAEQSLLLLSRLRWLRSAWGGRLLIGASRKSMLGAITGLATTDRLVPSTVAAALAAYQGADLVRVHDVAETVAALRLTTALRRAAGGAE